MTRVGARFAHDDYHDIVVDPRDRLLERTIDLETPEGRVPRAASVYSEVRKRDDGVLCGGWSGGDVRGSVLPWERVRLTNAATTRIGALRGRERLIVETWDYATAVVDADAAVVKVPLRPGRAIHAAIDCGANELLGGWVRLTKGWAGTDSERGINRLAPRIELAKGQRSFETIVPDPGTYLVEGELRVAAKEAKPVDAYPILGRDHIRGRDFEVKSFDVSTDETSPILLSIEVCPLR